jgi:hypothetical protein
LCLESLVLRLKNIMIHKQHIDSLQLRFCQSSCSGRLLALGNEILDQSQILGTVKMLSIIFVILKVICLSQRAIACLF